MALLQRRRETKKITRGGPTYIRMKLARLIGGLYTVQGTVRNLRHRGEFCDITFEHESNDVSLIQVYGTPPVWVGEHVRITLRHMEPPYDRIVSTERLCQVDAVP